MKANELMIGDLLKWKKQTGFNDEDRNMVLRVKNIFDDAIKIDGRFELYHISLFEPIPLTPEILEKNGFIRDPLWHHCDKDLDNYSISVQLGYANRIEYIKIAEKGKDNVIPSERTKLYLTHIKYVHQLQQGLRYCGISKEIEL